MSVLAGSSVQSPKGKIVTATAALPQALGHPKQSVCLARSKSCWMSISPGRTGSAPLLSGRRNCTRGVLRVGEAGARAVSTELAMYTTVSRRWPPQCAVSIRVASRPPRSRLGSRGFMTLSASVRGRGVAQAVLPSTRCGEYLVKRPSVS